MTPGVDVALRAARRSLWRGCTSGVDCELGAGESGAKPSTTTSNPFEVVRRPSPSTSCQLRLDEMLGGGGGERFRRGGGASRLKGVRRDQ